MRKEIFIEQKPGVHVVVIHQKRKTTCIDKGDFKGKSRHYIMLSCLQDVLKDSKECDVVFHSNDALLSFEWHEEYLKGGSFSNVTKDIELWDEIIACTKRNKIKLEIIGVKDFAKSFGKILLNDAKENKKECCLDGLVPYTTSKHRLFSSNVIKEIVEKRPEYYDIAKCFCLYPLLKWCHSVSVKEDLDIISLDKAIIDEERFCGINTKSNMDLQKQCLLVSGKIVATMNKALKEIPLSTNEINVIKDIIGDDVVSKYIFTNNIKSALVNFFGEYYMVFNDLVKEYENIIENVDTGAYCVFHNVRALLETNSKTKLFEAQKWAYDIDCRLLDDKLSKIIEYLKGYPFKQSVYRVIFCFYHGMNKTTIANSLNKDRKYVEPRIEEGLKVIEAILWGFVL